MGDFALRSDLRPGDLGEIVRLHGVLYAREHGFDPSFEAYVAGPMSEFVRAPGARQRLWIAEHEGRIVGSIAIVEADARTAQLRWFLVDPAARGQGLGRELLRQAVAFSREQGFASVILWTVDRLTAAAALYRAAGFRRVEARPARRWGVELVEESYELVLG